MSRTSLTEVRKELGKHISREDYQAAQYLFRTVYGYFPRVEDRDTFIPVVEFVREEWKSFFRGKVDALRKEFLTMILEKNQKK